MVHLSVFNHMKNSSRGWIYAFVISLLLAGCNNAEEKTKNPPKRNIVFILADDLGWNQV